MLKPPSKSGTVHPQAPSVRVGKTRVFIVDDHPVLVEGLTVSINNQPDLVVCGRHRS